MKNLTYVLIIDVEEMDARQICERLQGQEFDVFFASGCEYGARLPLLEAILKTDEAKSIEDSSNVSVMSLNDFMDSYNNEELNEVGTFMGYVDVNLTRQDEK